MSASLFGRSQTVVVVGCGRLGSYVANNLSAQGRYVIVVDRNPRAFGALSGEFSGYSVEADASEYQSLRSLALDKADAVLACTDNDNLNILVAQAAREVFGVRNVLARVLEAGRARLCHELDLPMVSPASVAGDVFLEAMAGADKEGS